MKISVNNPVPQPAQPSPLEKLLATAVTRQSAQKEGTLSAGSIPIVPAPAPKVSWLKKVGHVLGKILGIVAKDAKPIADTAAAVAEILMPQFASEIEYADGLVSRIAKLAIVQEGVAASVATATTGDAKLQAVTDSIGPEIDAWVEANFPGAEKAGQLEKEGLVNAVVALINKAKQAIAPAPAV